MAKAKDEAKAEVKAPDAEAKAEVKAPDAEAKAEVKAPDAEAKAEVKAAPVAKPEPVSVKISAEDRCTILERRMEVLMKHLGLRFKVDAGSLLIVK